MKQEQLYGWSHVSWGNSARDNHCLRYFLNQMHYKKMFDLENESQGQRFTMVSFDGDYHLRQKSWYIFAIALIISKIPTSQICDLENLGQGHVVQHSQWSQSMANINLYKSHMRSIFVSSHHFWDRYISKFVTLKKIGQGHDVQHLQWLHSMAYMTSYLIAIVMFALSLNRLRDIRKWRKIQKS